MIFDIILFLLIAAFVLIKLKGVLGNEYGDSVNQAENKDRKLKEIKITEAVNNIISDIGHSVSDNAPEFIDTIAIPDMKKLSEIIPNINAKNFVRISKKVFEIILVSYANKDEQMIKQLASQEISDRLINSIKKMSESGTKIVNILIKIDDVIIKKIDILEKIAVIYVFFTSQQINYSEDDKGNLISGDKEVVNKISELWHFQKELNSETTQWLLVNIENY